MVGLKVKIAATVAFLATIVTAVQYLIDDKPETAPDWTAIITTGSLAFGMWFSRQADVSSEAQAKAGTEIK